MAATAYKVFPRRPGTNTVGIAGTQVPAEFVFQMRSSKAVSTAGVLGDFATQTIAPLLGTATTFYYASSDNTQDKAAGTGAHTMRCWGVNTSGQIQYEDITLTGTTKVTGSLSFAYNPFLLELLTAGTDKVPTGNLLVGNSDHSAIYAVIPAGATHSNVCQFFLPSNLVAAFEMQLTFQCATTAYDGLYVSQQELTHVAAANVITREVQRVMLRGVANLDKQNYKFNGIMTPNKQTQFYSEDIGTTAQTLTWGLRFGIKAV